MAEVPGDVTLDLFRDMPRLPRELAQHGEHSGSTALLDATALSNAYRLFARESFEKDGLGFTPHHILDLAVVATAIIYFDRILFVDWTGGRSAWADFYRQALDASDGRFIHGIELRAFGEGSLWLQSAYSQVESAYRTIDVLDSRYRDVWLAIAQHRPLSPRDTEFRRRVNDDRLRSPKHPLQQIAEHRISEKQAEVCEDITARDERRVLSRKFHLDSDAELSEYCWFCTAKSHIYYKLAEALNATYLPCALRGAARLGLAVPEVEAQAQRAREELLQFGSIKRDEARFLLDVDGASRSENVAVLPVPVRVLFERRIQFSKEPWIDSIAVVRKESQPYRELMRTVVAQLRSTTEYGIAAARAMSQLETKAGEIRGSDEKDRFGLRLGVTTGIEVASNYPGVEVLGAILEKALSGSLTEGKEIRRRKAQLSAALRIADASDNYLRMKPLVRDALGIQLDEASERFLARLSRATGLPGF